MSLNTRLMKMNPQREMRVNNRMHVWVVITRDSNSTVSVTAHGSLELASRSAFAVAQNAFSTGHRVLARSAPWSYVFERADNFVDRPGNVHLQSCNVVRLPVNVGS